MGGGSTPSETGGSGGDVGKEMEKRPAPKAYGPHPHKIEWGPNVFSLYTDINNPFYYRTPKDKSNIELPAHVPQNPMNLELYLRDPRQRAFMTEAERTWRKKWVQDQNLHPDEPFYVAEIQYNMNPIRRIYRYPGDLIAEKFLFPKLGHYWGQRFRQWIPRYFFTYVGVCLLYSYCKYYPRSWDRMTGPQVQAFRPYLGKWDEIEEKLPGAIDKAFAKPVEASDFTDYGYSKRTIFLNVGESQRPW